MGRESSRIIWTAYENMYFAGLFLTYILFLLLYKSVDYFKTNIYCNIVLSYTYTQVPIYRVVDNNYMCEI